MNSMPKATEAFMCSDQSLITFFSDGKSTQFDVVSFIKREHNVIPLANDIPSDSVKVIDGTVEIGRAHV